MNAKKFSDAMSELDNKYIDEALNYKKKGKKLFWIKWGVIAACLCLIVPLTAFAIDTIQYNVAVFTCLTNLKFCFWISSLIDPQ